MSIVYVLTNDAMPGLIKTGMTDGAVEDRMRQLDTSGVRSLYDATTPRA